MANTVITYIQPFFHFRVPSLGLFRAKYVEHALATPDHDVGPPALSNFGLVARSFLISTLARTNGELAHASTIKA
jgi:hypothetical protein